MRTVSKKNPKPKIKKSGSKPSAPSWRTGTWVGLLLFVSVWMFIFGILVGRGTLSTEFKFDDSQKELYSMAEKAAKVAEKQDPTHDLTGEMASDPFAGLKNSNRGELKPDSRRTEKKPPPEIKTTKPSPPPKIPKKSLKSISPASPRPSPTAKAKPKPAPIPTPAAKKPEKTPEKIYRTLQAASMQDLDEAKRMAARLRKKGFNAYIASASASGKAERHRVRIGPYSNQKDADIALSRLKKEGIQGIILTNR